MKGKVVYLMLHLMEVCQKCWQLIREWEFHRITRDYRNWDICRILVTSHTYGAYSWSSMTKIWVWIYMYIVIYNVQCILTNNLNSRRMNYTSFKQIELKLYPIIFCAKQPILKIHSVYDRSYKYLPQTLFWQTDVWKQIRNSHFYSERSSQRWRAKQAL